MNLFLSFKKLTLVLVVFVLSAGIAMAQSSERNVTGIFPLLENFETGANPPAGWSAFDIDGDYPAWEVVDALSHDPEGTYCAFHSYGTSAQDGYLVTPQLSIPASGPVVLSFWSMIIDAEYYGKSSVLVSTDGNDPATATYNEIWTATELIEDWAQINISLSDYAGQDIYIAFRYEGDYAHVWAIDDIEVSSSINTDPKIVVTPVAVNAVGPVNSNVQKKLKVKNTGVDNLIYNMTVEYTGTASGWMNMSSYTGNITGGSNQEHVLTFNPTGLELGTYTAVITITSNDPSTPTLTVPVNYEIIAPATIGIDIMIPDYTFPYDISENGKFVAISGFGEGGSLWSKETGLHNISGTEPSAISVSETGIIAGDDVNPAYGATMAGTWNYQTDEWTFLGVNPAVGTPSGSDYNYCWGMTADGQTIVGMQYFPNYTYKAFKWTQAGGYEMIGNIIPESNRPNGISNDGSVVFGWADLANASRSPVIWFDSQLIKISPNDYGEASAASSDGQFVTGTSGSKGFLWSKQDGSTIFFDNSLNAGGINPVAVMGDGTIFGFTVEGWPPFPDARRAFVRLTDGEMMTFNDYAITRGMFEADEWLFFSINGVTPDGNKFIGAGINPNGEPVSFLIDFAAEIPTIVVAPLALDFALWEGQTQTKNITIQNTGTGNLEYNTVIHYLEAAANAGYIAKPAAPYQPIEGFHKGIAGFTVKGKIQPQFPNARRSENPMPAMKPIHNQLTSWEKPTITLTEKHAARSVERGSHQLHYDGDNVDAIGLVQGGSFFVAARFPQEMVNAFAGASLTQVMVYVNDMPTDAKLYIWGPGTTETPGSAMVEQNVAVTPMAWNTLTLTTPLTLDGNDIWVGMGYTNEPGTFIAGIDGGPANPNGCFLREASSEWERLTDYGFNSNFNIRANLILGSGDWLSLNPNEGIVEAGQSQTIVATANGDLPAGQYEANIIIQSNDLATPQVVIPVTLGVTVGLNENTSSSLSIYPVPANRNIEIRSDVKMVSVTIYNSRGQIVMEKNMQQSLSANLPIEQLPAGVYHLRMKDIANKEHSKTLVKQ
ncbi:MAG: choice-of-anchor J domain-containing protein [Bacteroidales bacterium]|nr:choice-of-anchor J domain-containing protein [Bacteroidales bacterium]